MKLNEGHYHEICDRAHIIAGMIDEHLMQAYKGGDKVLYARAKAAMEIMYEIYQYAWRRF